MDKEQLLEAIGKAFDSMAEAPKENAPSKAESSIDKVVIDLQKSYEKLSGQLDEINKKLVEKEKEPAATAEKKPLII